VLVVLLLHYCYDNYNTPLCKLCYYYTTPTDNYNTPPCPLCYYNTTTTTTTTTL